MTGTAAVAAAWQSQVVSDGADTVMFAGELLSELRGRLSASVNDLTGAVLASGRADAVLDRLTGLDPLYLVPALEELAAQGGSDPVRALAATALRLLRTEPEGRGPRRAETGLPVEHPLDYDWRFDSSTRALLAGLIGVDNPSVVLLLGCPTLAAEVVRMAQVTLIDDNPALKVPAASAALGGAAHVKVDLLARPRVTAGLDAEVVVADPPFYPEAMRAFLHAAAAGSQLGATLYLVLPTRWTRPSAVGDAAAALSTACDLGYERMDIWPDAARYVRPGFERAAHRDSGLFGVPDRWRTADTAVLRLRARTSAVVPALDTDRHQWREVSVSGRRWRVRIRSEAARAAAVTDRLLAGGAPMGTVSRRDKRRATANVITDDNRAFTTDQPALLLDVLTALASGHEVDTVVPRSLNRPVRPAEQVALERAVAFVETVGKSAPPPP